MTMSRPWSAARVADAPGQVDREAHGFGDLHVAELDFGESDGVGERRVDGRGARREGPDLEPVDVGLGEGHDLSGRREGRGPEIHGDGRPVVDPDGHAGQDPVPGTILRLHEGDMVGARAVGGAQDELLTGRVRATDSPRGAEIAVEGTRGPILGSAGAAVRGRVDGAAVLLDDRPSVVIGSPGTRRDGSPRCSGRETSGPRARSRPCCHGAMRTRFGRAGDSSR